MPSYLLNGSLKQTMPRSRITIYKPIKKIYLHSNNLSSLFSIPVVRVTHICLNSNRFNKWELWEVQLLVKLTWHSLLTRIFTLTRSKLPTNLSSLALHLNSNNSKPLLLIQTCKMRTLSTPAGLISRLKMTRSSRLLAVSLELRDATWSASLSYAVKVRLMSRFKRLWSSDSEARGLASKKAPSRKRVTTRCICA